jgi:HK97 family phage major capsid protein
VSQSKDPVTEVMDAFSDFKKFHNNELHDMRAQLDEVQAVLQRPFGIGGGHAAGSKMTTQEQKDFDGAIRALMVGDKGKADQLFARSNSMSVGSDPDGGYMVNPQFNREFNRIMAEISPLFRLARVINLDPGHDSFEEPIDRDVVEAAWVGEQDSRAETNTPQLKMFNVPVQEIYCMPKVTQKLVDLGGFDVMQWLQTKVGEGFGVKEGDAYHNGDGVARPRGFLTYDIATTADATRPWGTIQYIASGASGAFASPTASVSPADVLVDMTTALKPQYRTGAVWLMNRNTAGMVRKFKDGEGRFIWTDSLLVSQPAILLGYPVEIDENMPDIASDSLPIAFGNFQRAYTIVQKPGIKFLPDPYSAKPHVLLYSYRRVGGDMNNSEAIKLLRMAAS